MPCASVRSSLLLYSALPRGPVPADARPRGNGGLKVRLVVGWYRSAACGRSRIDPTSAGFPTDEGVNVAVVQRVQIRAKDLARGKRTRACVCAGATWPGTRRSHHLSD